MFATAILNAQADPEQMRRPIAPTFDTKLVQDQVQKNPESIAAAFVLFTALTRTDHVEEALRKLHSIKRLAGKENVAAALDQIITSYEEM